MKRVLVTGASGFIGRCTLPMLCDATYEVHAVSRNGSRDDGDRLHWHQVDLLDQVATRSLLDKLRPDCLLHLAWVTKPGEYWESPANLDWLCASIRMVESFIEYGGKRAVVAGSCAEYDWNYTRLDERSTPCNPGSLYGISKYSLFLILQKICRASDVGFAWGRVFFLYGEAEAESRFVPMLVNGMLDEKRVDCSDGSLKRDFLHASDAASAFVVLLQSGLSGAVNIASGEAVSLRQVADLVEAEFDHPGDIVFSGQGNAQPSELVADAGRLRKELGWEPAYSIEAGIKQVAGWWRKTRKGAR